MSFTPKRRRPKPLGDAEHALRSEHRPARVRREAVERLPPSLVVFDAIVMPETTPLLALAEACGCVTVRGREMMRGQIARIVDFFGV